MWSLNVGVAIGTIIIPTNIIADDNDEIWAIIRK
jgi:hypothetical protein